MKTITVQETLEDTVPTLQLERALVPIDEFAAREGVSRSAIEDWAKLGLVQIRRHKGKTFIVDVPPGPYDDSCRTLNNRQEISSASTPPKPTGFWQFTAIVSVICTFAAVLASLWLYSDRQGLLDGVTLVYEKIDKTNENFMHAKQQAEILQNQLDEAKMELDRLRGQFVRSQIEVKDVRNQLNNARQNIVALRQYNAEAAQRLNEQIEKLTELTDEVSKGR